MTLEGAVDFGIRARMVLFRDFKSFPEVKNSRIAKYTSLPKKSQADLKNLEVKPSGPGALSFPIWYQILG